MTAYHKQRSGEWVAPTPMRGYKMACCDCGLVHIVDFAIIRRNRGRKVIFAESGLKVIFRASRDERKTAAKRRENAKRKAA